MDYLERVLGIRLEYGKGELPPLPHFITGRYRIRRARLSGLEVLLLYPTGELDTVEAIKKHIARIQAQENCPVVLWLEKLGSRQKAYLLRERIPFVVEGRQIYLPFMATYLQERGSAEKRAKQTLLPSAQMLLLYLIYRGAAPTMASQAAKALSLTSTSVQRAVEQLAALGFITVRKEGVQKIIQCTQAPKELYEAATAHFQNPVRRVVYLPTSEIPRDWLKSGHAALSAYSMLNAPAVVCFAANHISQWESLSTRNLQSARTQSAVELWRYDPRRLSMTDTVDRLSLALALRDDADERVEEAVDNMLNELWRELDDKRN